MLGIECCTKTSRYEICKLIVRMGVVQQAVFSRKVPSGPVITQQGTCHGTIHSLVTLVLRSQIANAEIDV